MSENNNEARPRKAARCMVDGPEAPDGRDTVCTKSIGHDGEYRYRPVGGQKVEFISRALWDSIASRIGSEK